MRRLRSEILINAVPTVHQQVFVELDTLVDHFEVLLQLPFYLVCGVGFQLLARTLLNKAFCQTKLLQVILNPPTRRDQNPLLRTAVSMQKHHLLLLFLCLMLKRPQHRLPLIIEDAHLSGRSSVILQVVYVPMAGAG